MTAERWRRFLPPLLAAMAAWLTPGLERGEAYGLYAAGQALVTRGSPSIDGAVVGLRLTPNGPLNGAAYFNGHYYLAQSPVSQWLASLLYAVGALPAALLPGQGLAPLATSLLGPLLVGLLLLGMARLTRQHRLGAAGTVAVLALAGVLLPLTDRSVGLTGWLVAAVALAWLPVGGRWTGRGGAIGWGLLTGLLAAAQPWLAVAALVALSRAPAGRAVLAWRVVGFALPIGLVAGWQWLAFERPWRLAQQFAVAPSPVSALSPLTVVGIMAALLGGAALLRQRAWWELVVAGLVLAGALLAPGPLEGRLLVVAVATAGGWCQVASWSPSGRRVGVASIGALAVLAVVAAGVNDFSLPAPAVVAYSVEQRLLAAGLVLVVGLVGMAGVPGRRAVGGLAVAAVLLGLLVGGPATAQASADPPASLVPAFTVLAPSTGQPLTPWRLAEGARTANGRLTLPEAAAHAESPLVAARPGERYCASAAPAPGTLVLVWEDDGHRVLAEHGAALPERPVCFAAPPGTSGVRVRLSGGATPGEVGTAALWATSARVAPLPDGARAALAFTFDWESAMGGLIHSRGGSAAYEGDRAGPDRAGETEAVADARDRGWRMRQGAEILDELFQTHTIRGTFYATGYNLLTGNSERRAFASDPTYRWASRKNGWGSDYWATHPWYGDDPYGTEASDPAWYFGSLTRRLAAEGHEIETHTFGHLYVRGATPDELEADLREWNRAAVALGLQPARSFAFPWTSSNSVKEPHYERLRQLGITSVTRLYELRPGARFELDEVAGVPGLLIYPDTKLDSTGTGEAVARLTIDEVLARGGYQSLWTHPEEVVDPAQVSTWRAVVAYAAEARARGLWVAPLGAIVERVRGSRAVEVLTVADGGVTRLVVTNAGAASLEGVTVMVGGSPAGVSDGQRHLPRLAAGERLELVVAGNDHR